MLRRTSAAISPTALYTGTVWHRHGLSHPAFGTRAGAALWHTLAGPRLAVERLGAPSLDAMLLGRHHVIDTLLEEAIGRGEVGQVIELAAGLSPRGWRFTQRHGAALTYVETDLPAMAERKRALLSSHGLLGPHHRVLPLDAFVADGPGSLAALAETLDPDVGTAVISEGLLNYFPMADVRTLWRSVGTTLGRFPHGLYLADLHLDRDTDAVAVAARAFITVVVRGAVHPHFDDEDQAVQALLADGFDDAVLLRPSDFGLDPATGVDRNYIVRATTGVSPPRAGA